MCRVDESITGRCGMPTSFKIILAILIPTLLLFGLALVLLRMPLPAALDQRRNLFVAVLVGFLGLAFLVGLSAYLFNLFRGQARALDPVFARWELGAGSYTLLGRQYQGHIEGRPATVYFIPAHRYNANELDIYLGTGLPAEMAAARQGPLLSCADCPALDSPGPGLEHLQVRARDPDWARRLLADPAARAALLGLVGDSTELYFQRGQLWLRARPRGLSEEQVRQWVTDMQRLLQIGEELAGVETIPPQLPPQARTRAVVTPVVGLVLLVACLPAFLLICVGVAIAILNAFKR